MWRPSGYNNSNPFNKALCLLNGTRNGARYPPQTPCTVITLLNQSILHLDMNIIEKSCSQSRSVWQQVICQHLKAKLMQQSQPIRTCDVETWYWTNAITQYGATLTKNKKQTLKRKQSCCIFPPNVALSHHTCTVKPVHWLTVTFLIIFGQTKTVIYQSI